MGPDVAKYAGRPGNLRRKPSSEPSHQNAPSRTFILIQKESRP